MADTTRHPRSELPATSVGTNRGDFGWTEWGLLAAIASIWGSSFFFIAVGLEAFSPGVITMARAVLGVATLAVFSRARVPIAREDQARVALLGVIWIALPLVIFPVAQQWIDSSVAGMLNGAMPVVAALWATMLLRKLPGTRQLIGIAIGFLGVIAIFLPEVRESSATALGAALVMVAVVLYALSANLAVPLQQRYGALPVLLRAQIASLVIVVPIGVAQLPSSTWAWDAALAMIPLGVLGTGLAFVFMATLVGRAGAPRGSIAIYFVPIVAVVLGVVILGEDVAGIAIVGVILVILGAWITSRREV